jgi:hypothetical protein
MVKVKSSYIFKTCRKSSFRIIALIPVAVDSLINNIGYGANHTDSFLTFST